MSTDGYRIRRKTRWNGLANTRNLFRKVSFGPSASEFLSRPQQGSNYRFVIIIVAKVRIVISSLSNTIPIEPHADPETFITRVIVAFIPTILRTNNFFNRFTANPTASFVDNNIELRTKIFKEKLKGPPFGIWSGVC